MSFFNFLNSGKQDCYTNMATDEWLLRRSEGLFVRLYGWQPAAVSVGYGQNPAQELNLEKLTADGIDVVRRLTGGRAVLHAEELTYSVCGDIGGIFGTTLAQTYEIIASALRSSLLNLKIPVELEKGGSSDMRVKNGVSLPCFASTSRWEITLEGRKLVGSAQRREKNRFLQHGSILLSGKNRLISYLKLSGEAQIAYAETLETEAVSLEEAGYSFSETGAQYAFCQGFEEVLNIKSENIQLDSSGEDFSRLRKAYIFHS